MKHAQLGPNKGIMYALETLEANLEWIKGELAKLGSAKPSNIESNKQITTSSLTVLDKSSYSLPITR
jgi:Conserved hypothetical ATP binding protein